MLQSKQIQSLQLTSKNILIIIIIFFIVPNTYQSFTFSTAIVSANTYVINTNANYNIHLLRNTDDSLNPTPWDSSVMPSTAKVIIHFPSPFTYSLLQNSQCVDVIVNTLSVTGYSCSVENATIVISNLFSGSQFISQVYIMFSDIKNPSIAILTPPLIGIINTDVSNSGSAAELQFQPDKLTQLSITFQLRYVNTTSDMIITIINKNQIPANGLIRIKFPSTIVWQRDMSNNHLIPINQTLNCYGRTSNINNSTITCKGLYSTQQVTISNPFSSIIPASSTIIIGIIGLFSPPTTQPIDTLLITTYDNNLNPIDDKTSFISGLIPLNFNSFSLRSSLTGAVGVNNFLGGISFQFTLSDNINPNDYIMINFPSGTQITYITSSSPSFRITNMNYNSTNLTLMIYQQSTNPNYNAGTTLDLTFIRYRTPPSIKPTLPITFTILQYGYSKMIGSGSITAVNNNYSLSVAVGSSIINTYTSYNLIFTMSDALTTTGYIIIQLDPLLCKTAAQIATITSNLTISIKGTSIKQSISTQISTVTVNGQITYQLKLSNLNISSSNIISQGLNITINNLLNPPYVIGLTYFKLQTYYSSDQDLVAIATYTGSITLQRGNIQLVSLSTTATTTYTFTNITINIINTNAISNQGYIIVTIPSQLILLDVCNSFLQYTSNSSSIATTFTNILTNNSVILRIGSQISSYSSLSYKITGIMTQSTTKPTSSFFLQSFTNNYNAIDASLSSTITHQVTHGNNFNYIGLQRQDLTNSKITNYLISFQQIQNSNEVMRLEVLVNQVLSLDNLGRVYQLVYNGLGSFTTTALIFSKVNGTIVKINLISNNGNSTFTIKLQGIKNPPSLSPLVNPLKLSTKTLDFIYKYSQMYTTTIINTLPSSMTINNYQFTNYIYGQYTNLTLNINGISQWPNLIYSLNIHVPLLIGLSNSYCKSSIIIDLECSIFLPTNTITVIRSNSNSSLPVNLQFTVYQILNPISNLSSPYIFQLVSRDSQNYQVQEDRSTIVFVNNCTQHCRTCENSNSTSCLSCYTSIQTNYTLLYEKNCLTSCPNHTYLSGSNCINCDSVCLTCLSVSSNCTSCDLNSSNPYVFLNSTLVPQTGYCHSECPLGTYLNNISCSNCHDSCSSCNSSYYCFNCTFGFNFYKGNCLSTCPNTTTVINQTCQQCSLPCISCMNTTSNCLSCTSFRVLINNTCSQQCQNSNQYVTNESICQPCNQSCQKCSILSGNCTKCDLNSSLPYFYNNTCLIQCPITLYPEQTTKICLDCKNLSIGCDNCSSKTTCLSCNSPLYLFVQNSSCISSIPKGYYEKDGNIFACNSSCVTCVNNSFNCTECIAGYYLMEANFTCLQTCQNGTVPTNTTRGPICSICDYPCLTCNTSTTDCLSCQQTNGSLFISNNGTCVMQNQCSNGTYASMTTFICTLCSAPCSSCKNQSFCKICAINFSLIEESGICNQTCPIGYLSLMIDNSLKCNKCQYPCQTCQSNLNNCTSCSQKNGSLFLNFNACVQDNTCPNMTYPNSTTFQCTLCTSPCNTCLNELQCTSCIDNLTLFTVNKSCMATCPFGYISLIESNISICKACSSNCSDCKLSIDNCTSCLQGNSSLFLSNNTCVDITLCPNGTYANSSSFICQLCPITCKSCVSLTNCTQCQLELYLDKITFNCISSSSCPSGTVSGYNSSSGRNQCLLCLNPCQSCISTIQNCTSCLQPINSSLFLSKNQCVNSSSCQTGFYANESSFQCRLCQSPCVNCLNLTYCYTCIQDYFLKDNFCKNLCPDGTYVGNNSGILQCMNCSDICSICHKSPTNCTSCPNNTFLSNSTCVNNNSCPLGTYPNETINLCATCELSCFSCSNNSFCLNCSQNYYLIAESGLCVLNCFNGTFGNSSSKLCEKCNLECLTCQGSNIYCLSCINPSSYLYNGSCIDPTLCPNGTFSNQNKSICENCSPPCSFCQNSTFCKSCVSGTYLLNNTCLSQCPNTTAPEIILSQPQCVVCSYPCLTCKQDVTNCSSCFGNLTLPLFYYNNSCFQYNNCPNTTYHNNITFQCSLCKSPCSFCENQSLCITCQANYYLFNSTCLMICPNGTLAQNITSGGSCLTCILPCITCSLTLTTCLSCSQNITELFLYNGTCVNSTVCPSGYYPNVTDLQCKACNVQCNSCLNLSTCISCKTQLYLFNSSCISLCPNGTTSNSTKICQSCVLPCLHCNFEPTICINCVNNYYFYKENSSCLQNCPIGYVQTGKICQMCYQQCLTCSIKTINCTQCKSLYLFVLNGTCVELCPPGYFNNHSTSFKICSQCINNCKTCNSSTQCISCSPPLLLNINVCSNSCPNTIPFNQSNICMSCSQAKTGCIQCNTNLTKAFCLNCTNNLIRFQGNCLNQCPNGYIYDSIVKTCLRQNVGQDALTKSLKTSTTFPLPFTITGSIIFIACFMSKLQNRNSYVIGTAYSLFGFIQTGCLAYTIIVYNNFINSDNPDLNLLSYLQIGLILIVALNMFSLFLQSYQLYKDDKFKKWLRNSCNYVCYVIISIISAIFNYKIKLIIFTKLFSFQCLKAQLQSVQKFKVFNFMSFLGMSHEGLILYISGLIMATLLPSHILFLTFLDLVLINIFNIVLSLLVSHKQQTFFQEQEDDGIKINKVFNAFEQYDVNQVNNEKQGTLKPKDIDSRDMLDQDDEFTLSISDRQSQKQSSKANFYPKANSNFIKKNQSALIDANRETQQSLKKNNADKSNNGLHDNDNSFNRLSNISAVYVSDLSPQKRKQFEQTHQISKDITQKSKKQKQSIQNKIDQHQQNNQYQLLESHNHINIFDVGNQQFIQQQINDKGLNQIDNALEKYDEKHQFGQFQSGEVYNAAVLVGLAKPPTQPMSQFPPNDINANKREIKVYKGRNNLQNQPQDIEEIDLTISKKQRQLIEIRKNIRKKQRQRQRSRSRKNRSGSKDKHSSDALSQFGLSVNKHNKHQIKSTNQNLANQLQIVDRQNDQIEQHFLNRQSSIKKDENPITLLNKPAKLSLNNNTIEQQLFENSQMINKLQTKQMQVTFPLQQGIMDEVDDILLEESSQNIKFIQEQSMNIHNTPNKIKKTQKNTTQQNIQDLLVNNLSKQKLSTSKKIQDISPNQKIRGNNNIFQENSIKQDIKKSQVFLKHPMNNIEQIDQQYKSSALQHQQSQQHLEDYQQQPIAANIIQYNQQISEQLINKQHQQIIIKQQQQQNSNQLFLKKAGHLTKPLNKNNTRINKKIINQQTEQQIYNVNNSNQLYINMKSDELNQPLQNKMKQINKLSIFDGSLIQSQEGDQLDQIIQRTQRTNNRSHLMKNSRSKEKINQNYPQFNRSNIASHRVASKDHPKHIPTQISAFQEMNDTSTIKQISEKDFTERKYAMNKPPMYNNRPMTSQKNGRMMHHGMMHVLDDKSQSPKKGRIQGFNNNANTIGNNRTSYDMRFKEIKSKQFYQDQQSDLNYDVYPSTFNSNQIRVDSEELLRQPMKPKISKTARMNQHIRQDKQQQPSLNNSIAKKSLKSYKSRSIDRDEADEKYLKNSREKRMTNSRQNNHSRERKRGDEDQQDILDSYYKKGRESPSGHSNRSKKSRSKSRQANRSSQKRILQLQKIYLQRLQIKK